MNSVPVEGQACGYKAKRKPTPNLSGQRFERWLVLDRDNSKKGNSRFWCKCECGNMKSVPTRYLVSGESKSCGCFHKELTKTIHTKNLAGFKNNRWTIIERDKSKQSRWFCLCECGVIRSLKGDAVLSGRSKSCGCLQKEIVKSLRNNLKHGETGSRLWRIWAAIKARCTDTNQLAYKNYGGRGIMMCDEWANSYESFRDWARENGYADDLTIERKNVNGNYEPANCTFISRAEQARNKRTTVYLTAWSETKRLFEWLADERCTVPTTARIRDRLNKGFTPEDAISKPYRKTHNKK